MTPDESDLRLRGIHDEWQRWCRGPGANVSFVSTPIARVIDTPGPCEPCSFVALRFRQPGRHDLSGGPCGTDVGPGIDRRRVVRAVA